MLQILTFIQATVMGIKARLDERGATAVEYGLMVSLIAVAIILAVQLLGTNLDTMFDNVNTKVDTTP
jgi:pilus assembly protein Flp/PilA